MRNQLLFLLLLSIGLTGCQSMGEHFNCLSEVDRTVPAQTQQKYIRTDTKCTRSNEQTVTGAFGTTWGTVYNPGQGDINCSSTPIYETIVLNQAQRDVAYRQCRNKVSNQNLSSQGFTASTAKSPEEIKKYDLQRNKCDSIKDNTLFLECMRGARSCNEQGENQCRQLNRRCVSNGITQWCAQ